MSKRQVVTNGNTRAIAAAFFIIAMLLGTTRYRPGFGVVRRTMPTRCPRSRYDRAGSRDTSSRLRNAVGGNDNVPEIIRLGGTGAPLCGSKRHTLVAGQRPGLSPRPRSNCPD